jgi:hypothetical protein
MTPRVAFLLGRSLWTRSGGAWSRETLAGPGSPAALAAERLSSQQAVREPKTVLVFEPEGMAHQEVETPRVRRRVFASLSRVQRDHPVVASEHLGWGIEPPEPSSGGAFSTLLHFELTGGLAHIHEACAAQGSRLVAAWPAFTASRACARSHGAGAGPEHAIILARNFASLSSWGAGRRSFRSWSGPMADADWRSLAAALGGPEGRLQGSLPEAPGRRGRIAVFADEDPRELCPCWGQVSSAGRLDSVLDFGALAAGAARMPASHPANLAGNFPRPRRLNGALAAGASVAASAALVLACLSAREGAEARRDRARSEGRLADLESRVEALRRNKAETERLERAARAEPAYFSARRRSCLLALSGVVPDQLVLTSLSLGEDGGFALEALALGPAFDSTRFRSALEGAGFAPAAGPGWSFDAASGRLRASGWFAAHRT